MAKHCDRCGGELVEKPVGFGSRSITAFAMLFLVSLIGTIAVPMLLPVWILVLICSLSVPFVLRKRVSVCPTCGE
ncbi:MAG: hypothetical protein K1X36_12890 [Pyrinomonadaceae bacterium]|nr:hypothetical protein [Pyrinomonadaceae bacterium]